MLTLTDNAADKVRALLQERDGYGEDSLRLFVKPGGCTGFSYGMSLDSRKDGDSVYELKGVSIVVDEESMELLDGSEIDFVDDLTGQGFKINNPNATSMCGCGSSFRTATKAGQPGSCD
ncbi:MAG: iron-sulfur cluster assembly accessory protein [Alicyclobacillaceae bacterium]|nr:iron-sulfur cluster assembly accessory protein [Alicyclobacillaceae bacterium]